jgi:hypothetical protein
VTEADRSAIILELAAQLRAHGSWAGETHVQKAAYVMQELLGVPSEFRFVLYKHGPFSFELRDFLNRMETWGYIRFEEQPYPYGPKIIEGDLPAMLRSESDAPKLYGKGIEFVARQLGMCNVSELERISTALFIERDSSVSAEERAERLNTLKPHVSLKEASRAFERLEEIRRAATDGGFSLAGRGLGMGSAN